MITDVTMQVSTDQDISQVVGTYVSTDSVDLNVTTGGRVDNEPWDFGAGNKMRAVFAITAAVVGTSSTVQFQIITDSTGDLATAPVVIGTSIAIPEANLTLGALVVVEANPDIADAQSGVQRFLGCQYVIGTATTTAGTVTATFVHDYQDGRRFYPSGFTVI